MDHKSTEQVSGFIGRILKEYKNKKPRPQRSKQAALQQYMAELRTLVGNKDTAYLTSDQLAVIEERFLSNVLSRLDSDDAELTSDLAALLLLSLAAYILAVSELQNETD